MCSSFRDMPGGDVLVVLSVRELVVHDIGLVESAPCSSGALFMRHCLENTYPINSLADRVYEKLLYYCIDTARRAHNACGDRRDAGRYVVNVL